MKANADLKEVKDDPLARVASPLAPLERPATNDEPSTSLFPAALCGYDPDRAANLAKRPVLYWRPGGPETKKWYSTWAEMYLAFKKTTGSVTISVDNTFQTPCVPAGYWDFEARAMLVGAHAVPLLLIPKDAHVLNVLMFSRLELKTKKGVGRGDERRETRDERLREEPPTGANSDLEDETAPTAWDVALDRVAKKHGGLLKLLAK
jgi:hypothetical protein